MKKLLSIFLLAFVLVLSACGNEEPDEADVEEEQEPKQDEVKKDEPEEYKVASTAINFHDGAITVSGKTNLPKGDEVMISVSNDEIEYFANDQDEVDASGVFSSAAFTKQGDPLPPGEYKVKITSVKIGKLEHEETVTIE